MLTAPGGSQPIARSVRERIEPHLGVDLSTVRVRQGPAAAQANRDLGARAFTSGTTIFLGAGASPGDLGLMAHEATHVAQQSSSALARSSIMRDVGDLLPDISVADVIPDWVLDGVRTAVRAIPGYTLLTYVTGTDPLTDEPVSVGPQELIEKLLTYGPFGAAVGPVLQAVDVLGEVFTFVTEGLVANGLTMARVRADIGRAWDELSVSNGIEGNAAIVRRYVTAFLRDVANFVASIVDRVIAAVRAVVADVAEPLLESPQIAPVWNLARKVLHYDPLRGVEVKAPTVEIIADFLRLIGQEQRLAQMEERGTLQQTADWLDAQLGTFAGLVGELGTLFSDAWAAIQPENLPNLLADLQALAQRAFGLVLRVGDFAATLIGQVLALIKDALLGWLSEHAHQVPGFHLLTVILGQNPFTGEQVPRTAENLIKGFITLMPGGEATYQQLAESGVIGAAAARIETEMTRLGISLAMVTGLFLGVWDTLTLDDLLDPIGAFGRVLALFGEPLARLVEFVGVVIQVVVTLILQLLNFPSDLLGSIVTNAVQAIEDIKRDPVAFLQNMLQAVKLGFLGFFDNIVTYLTQGLQAWLFRGLGQLGITIPPDLTLASVFGLVVSVLGITVEALWAKLGQHIGPERVALIRRTVDRLEGAWAFLKDVATNGLPAVWRYLTDRLTGLWDTLLGMARDWVMTTVVQRVTARLISMLDPTGVMAVINSFVAFFAAVQSAIEYLRDILEIVNRYVTTFAQIAAGNVVPGAQMLEQGLAAAIPVAIGFLANQVGLGNIPEKVVEIIGRLRELVDQALDWLVAGAVRLGLAALDALGLGPGPGPAGAAPAAPGAAGAPAMHVPFEIVGQQHEILSDPSGQLKVASNGAHPVADLAPLTALNAEYDALPPTATGAQRVQVLRRMIAVIQADPRLVALLTAAGGALPAGLDVAAGDSVLVRTDEGIVGARVLETHVTQSYGRAIEPGVWIQGGLGRRFYPYELYGPLTDPAKRWQREPSGRPSPVAFHAHGGPGQGGYIRMSTPLTAGSGADIPVAVRASVGYGPPGIWTRAGHMVAREFGGPGGWSSGNIAPLTVAANHTAPGMRGIEGATSRAVKADPSAVFDYSARAIYGPRQRPPLRIEVMVAKIWPPGSTLPPSFPSLPYMVDNTK